MFISCLVCGVWSFLCVLCVCVCIYKTRSRLDQHENFKNKKSFPVSLYHLVRISSIPPSQIIYEIKIKTSIDIIFYVNEIKMYFEQNTGMLFSLAHTKSFTKVKNTKKKGITEKVFGYPYRVYIVYVHTLNRFVLYYACGLVTYCKNI